jgi:hypothetical protein
MDNIAPMMFLDGDKLEDVLADKSVTNFGGINYKHDNFNALKIGLLHIEEINPDLQLVALLWQLRADNRRLMYIAVAGSSLGYEGYDTVPAIPQVQEAIEKGAAPVKKREDGAVSYYYPVRNSDGETVGALELIYNHFIHRKELALVNE